MIRSRPPGAAPRCRDAYRGSGLSSWKCLPDDVSHRWFSQRTANWLITRCPPSKSPYSTLTVSACLASLAAPTVLKASLAGSRRHPAGNRCDSDDHVDHVVSDLERGLATAHRQQLSFRELNVPFRVLEPGVHEQRALGRKQRPLRRAGSPVGDPSRTIRNWIEANVASASANVPPTVARSATVTQSVTRRSLGRASPGVQAAKRSRQTLSGSRRASRRVARAPLRCGCARGTAAGRR